MLYKLTKGKVKYYLSDYSISKNLAECSWSGDFQGESKYLSPELTAADELSIGLCDLKKADVFALGMCVLDVMLGGLNRRKTAERRTTKVR